MADDEWREGELSYARVEDSSIDDAWGVFKDGELIAVVDTETMAARLCAAEEMLTALRAFLDMPYPAVGQFMSQRTASDIQRHRESVRAAIAKATISERTAQ